MKVTAHIKKEKDCLFLMIDREDDESVAYAIQEDEVGPIRSAMEEYIGATWVKNDIDLDLREGYDPEKLYEFMEEKNKEIKKNRPAFTSKYDPWCRPPKSDASLPTEEEMMKGF